LASARELPAGLVHGHPLRLLEIQHALLRALRRGVRLRTLFGNASW
jgi:hypothetical protein